MTDARVKLAVFDCDGTLVDSQHSIIASMDSAFDAHGVPRVSERPSGAENGVTFQYN